jgi:hypothetical protein
MWSVSTQVELHIEDRYFQQVLLSNSLFGMVVDDRLRGKIFRLNPQYLVSVDIHRSVHRPTPVPPLLT